MIPAFIIESFLLACTLPRDETWVTDEWFADNDRVKSSVGIRDPEPPAPLSSEVGAKLLDLTALN
jgi:hypothetical protein